MQTMDAKIDHSAFTDLNDLIFDVLRRLCYDLLNAGGVNASVLHKAV